jgi:hypothetical protein
MKKKKKENKEAPKTINQKRKTGSPQNKVQQKQQQV